jgi:hypothetical protein
MMYLKEDVRMMGATTQLILDWTLLGILLAWFIIFVFLAVRPKSMHLTRQSVVSLESMPFPPEPQARLHITAPQPAVQIERAS